jgi:dTDP-4-amino-4,6-dideoxy-D-glucose transaminase
VPPERPTRRAAAGKRPAILGGAPTFPEFIYVARAAAPDADRLARLLARVFASRQLTNDGILVHELQERLALRLGVGWCAALTNGTTALQLALRALDLSGDVITTPFTFPATVHAIDWLGLTPVFCDIDPETYNLDPAAAETLITDRTSAILGVHVFGNPCDVRALERLRVRRGVRLIYDAAHAFDVRVDGRGIGTWGDLSALSFHAAKMFHTAEGGALVGADAALFERVAALRNFGIRDESTVHGVGINGKMSELHAAVGLALFDRIDDEIATRRRLQARYVARLGEVEGIRFQRVDPATTPNHAYCTIEIDPTGFGLSRDQVRQALLFENIAARHYFWPLCSENPYYRGLPSAAPYRLPNAHRVASRVLSLPLYGELSEEMVDRIGDALIALHAAAPLVRNRLPAGGSAGASTTTPR